jgi:integrating conjugative element protein (TIGR03755 family)
MKKSIIGLAVTALLMTNGFGVSKSSAAEDTLDPRLVFEIGGKAKIKQRRNTNIPVGAGVRWKTPMCGNFDMSLSVTNILNGVTGQLEKLGDDLLASVTGAISNWPMMEIARSDPQLYEFIQQGKLEASELFNASVASCEEMTDKMIREGYGNGGSPGSWVEVSGFEDWGDSDPESDDVVQVEEIVDREKGDGGVKWIGGDKAAGKDQPPIDTVADTVKAGVNLLANRDVQSSSNLPQNDDAPWFAKYWKDPEEAANWVTDIVGETTIRTCVDCERLTTRPGTGVYAKMEEEQRRIEDRLLTLLDTPTTVYDPEDLAEISAPGYALTQQVMEALKGESLYREALVERLAEEVAIADIVERLIAARRIMLSGLKEAHVAQNPDAVQIITSRINELGEEMDLLRQDAELRASTKQSVAVTLLNRKVGREKYNGVAPSEDMADAIRKMTGRGQ